MAPVFANAWFGANFNSALSQTVNNAVSKRINDDNAAVLVDLYYADQDKVALKYPATQFNYAAFRRQGMANLGTLRT